MIPNVSHESRTNSTPGTPDGVPWARCPWPSVGHVSALPAVAEFSWFQLRVVWASKTSCATIEMTPQKMEHMQPWVFEAYTVVYIHFCWFVWCVIFLSNTQPMTCPLQVLMQANPTKATSTATSIAVSKPAQWIPSPKIIPSVDQQSHTWDDSEIVIHRRCTHIVKYYINYSRIWDTMSFGNGRPAIEPCKKKNNLLTSKKQKVNLWMDHPLLFCC